MALLSLANEMIEILKFQDQGLHHHPYILKTSAMRVRTNSHGTFSQNAMTLTVKTMKQGMIWWSLVPLGTQ